MGVRKMTRSPAGWWTGPLVVAVLLCTMTYALAEQYIVSTYYPSPRGVYNELRVGSGPAPSPSPRLYAVQSNAAPAFRIDDQASDPTPFVVDENGNVGIGTPTPTSKLQVQGSAYVGGSLTVDGQISLGQDFTATWIEGGSITLAGPVNVTGNLTANNNVWDGWVWDSGYYGIMTFPVTGSWSIECGNGSIPSGINVQTGVGTFFIGLRCRRL